MIKLILMSHLKISSQPPIHSTAKRVSFGLCSPSYMGQSASTIPLLSNADKIKIKIAA